MIKYFLFISTLFVMYACNEAPAEKTESAPVEEAVEVVNEPNGNINELLSKEDFKNKMLEIGTYNLIDVRTPQEMEENGAIDGAFNIDFYAADFKDKLGALDKEVPTFIYCRSGGRSGQTAAIMKDLGFKEVYDLDGGFMAWTGKAQ